MTFRPRDASPPAVLELLLHMLLPAGRSCRRGGQDGGDSRQSRGGLAVEHEAGIKGGRGRSAMEGGLPRSEQGAGPLVFDLALGDGGSCAE
jgi:hypothetical protein